MPELTLVSIETPVDANMILGHAHFIKTAEDLYEAIMNSVPNAKFGVAFSEASGPRLVRSEGNDEALKRAAERELMKLGCGHAFLIFQDRKSTRLNSSHVSISYAVFCLKKK